MHSGDDVPRVSPDATLTAALVEMTRKHLGMTAVVDADQRLLGVFTDGDLRRALDDEGVDLRGATVAELMTRGPKTIGSDKLAAEGVVEATGHSDEFGGHGTVEVRPSKSRAALAAAVLE